MTALPQIIPVGFEFNVAADLIVYNGGATNTANNPALILTLGSDYSVTSGGGYNAANELQTGSITAVSGGTTGVAVGDYLTILRNISLVQATSFVATGPKTPLLTEQDDDRLTTVGQELLDPITRSMRAPPQENSDWVMPNSTTRASAFPFFNSSGVLTIYTLADLVAAIGTGTSGSTVHANYVYAGPTTGAAATPTFRALVASDFTGLTGFALAGAVGSSLLTMATSRILGRTTGGTGAIESLTVGSSLSLSAGVIDTIQPLTSTSSPDFKRVTTTRTDNDYQWILVGAVESFGMAISGTTFQLDNRTTGHTLLAFDASDNTYLSRLTTNGLVRTGSSNGVLSVASFGQIPGTATNDNASAGNVGESGFAQQQTPQSLTSTNVLDIVTLSLTAGDWDVVGVPYFEFAASTTISALAWWVSTTSASFPGFARGTAAINHPITAAAGNAVSLPTSPLRVSVSGTTIVYFTVTAIFAVSTATSRGMIIARRVR